VEGGIILGAKQVPPYISHDLFGFLGRKHSMGEVIHKVREFTMGIILSLRPQKKYALWD
jgi:hypothetical protein